MYNKVVLAAMQHVLSLQRTPIRRTMQFKNLGASQQELNWILFETERRLKTQLPEGVITRDSTVGDLLKSVVDHSIKK